MQPVDVAANDGPGEGVRLSVIVVCFGGDVVPVLDALQAQRRPGDEVLVVDNLASAGGTAAVGEHPAIDRLLRPPGNLHYAHGEEGSIGAQSAPFVEHTSETPSWRKTLLPSSSWAI